MFLYITCMGSILYFACVCNTQAHRSSSTYNFPQGRVTDHRIKLTLHRLENVLNGDLDEIIDSLIAADQAAKLSNLQDAE